MFMFSRWCSINGFGKRNSPTKMQQNFLTQMQRNFPINMKQNFRTTQKSLLLFGSVEIVSLHSLFECTFLNMFDCDLNLSSPCPPFLIPYVLLLMIHQLWSPPFLSRSLFPVYCRPCTLTCRPCPPFLSTCPRRDFLARGNFFGERQASCQIVSLTPTSLIPLKPEFRWGGRGGGAESDYKS